MHYKGKKHEHLVDRAKQLICSIIFDVDNEESFNRGAIDADGGLTNWYRYLWDAIVSGQTPDKLADLEEPLNFNVITFNYDTSLEYFLYNMTRAKGSMFDAQQQSMFLQKLARNIHHVYGQTLNYEWAGGSEHPTTLSIPGSVQRQVHSTESAKSIFLINDREDSNLYTRLQGLIKDSFQVIFLGFAFDDTNIGAQVLDLKETLKPKHVGRETSWFPVVKYTNYNDHEIINRKIDGILKSHEKLKFFTTHNDHGDTLRPIKSIKKVYQALAEDFSLNTL